jgi:hypothetical protein
MRFLGLDHLIRAHIDMERMALPSFVDELHLAEPLPPLILGLDFFDQARLDRHRRPDARDDVVSCERQGVLVGMRHNHYAPCGEQQESAEPCTPRVGALKPSHGHAPVTGRHAMGLSLSQDTACLRQQLLASMVFPQSRLPLPPVALETSRDSAFRFPQKRRGVHSLRNVCMRS